MKYDVIVVGCGPAGLSAAIYLGRARVKTLIVGKYKESQLIKAHLIENFFGFPSGISGKDLLQKGIKQAKRFGVKILDNEVVGAEKVKEGFSVKLDNKSTHSAKVLIIATGTPIRLSGIENEEKLQGKGVQYCVECDGALYRDKNVAVIGNGNHAAESAMDLKPFTDKVTLISNAPKFEFSPAMEKGVRGGKIKMMKKMVESFEGKKFLETIVLEGGERMKVDGVFMACGTASALDFANKLGLMIKENILQVDKNNMTSVNGIFAAGNCAGKCRQVAKNVGEGCNAGLSAVKYIRNKKIYFDYST